MRALAWALGVLLGSASAAGQSLFVRGPEPAVVKPGGEALVALELEGTPDDVVAELVPPVEISGLEVRVGAPTRSSFETLDQGRMARAGRVSWEISLRPAHPGIFEVPPLVVRAGGESFASPAIQLECVTDIAGEEYAFVELSSPRAEYFLQERIRLVIRFGIDREFLRTNVIQMFARELDVPVQLHVPWIPALARTTPIDDEVEPASKPPAERHSIALDEEIADALRLDDRELDGRTFLVLEVEKEFFADGTGELHVPAPFLRFACATRFQEDYLSTTVPADWQLAFVHAEPLVLQIHPLPEEGRPVSFTGAVGRFTVSTEAHPGDPQVGDKVELVLHIEGEGNLDSFEAPRLDPPSGFHVYGETQERRGRERLVTYDLAPSAEGELELPAIAFSFFDPSDPPGYRTIRTEPIPLHVRPPPASEISPSASPGSDGPAVPGRDEPRTRDTPKPPSRSTDEPRYATALVLGILAILVLSATMLWLRRKRSARMRA